MRREAGVRATATTYAAKLSTLVPQTALSVETRRTDGLRRPCAAPSPCRRVGPHGGLAHRMTSPRTAEFDALAGPVRQAVAAAHPEVRITS